MDRYVTRRVNELLEISDENYTIENEELLLRNTFMNAQMGPIADFQDHTGTEKTFRLIWVDHATNNRFSLAREDPDRDLANKTKVPKVTIHKRIKSAQLNPILKH